MNAFFAIGDAHTAAKMLAGRRVLFSFAYVGTRWLAPKPLAEVCAGATEVMIDSGAFTAWRQGKPVDLDAYLAWLAGDAPRFDWAIGLDVIGDAAKSLANFRQMLERVPSLASRLMPVWHEGDPPEHLDAYVSLANRVALGRIEGRRSEQKTFLFYDEAFNRQPDAKFHALGQANAVQLEPYPFASFDSTGWQRDSAYSNAARWPFNRCTRDTRMRAYIEATETICHTPPKQTSLAFRPAREVA